MAVTDWREATVARIRPETPRAATMTLEVPDWHGHRAGQHVDVRLTAEDGYRAQRRYSIASAPEGGAPQITVVEVDGGEVSPWMVSVAREEDRFEVRGPFGGWFVWEPAMLGEVLMIGGGSGLVPLMSMLRAGAPARLLVSARERDDVLYLDELEKRELDVTFTYTRRAPLGWTGYDRRVDYSMLREWAGTPGPRVYVCGPTAFVESVANDLVSLGHEAANIRTERFG
ncbi:ferredoxin reductase [Solirubrobacter phytolaccae]|uniref:Ferredoxin reductase n=1 Tax=Solirubrobacter phytolaccae TaxID=1404360 RepID=A0A9X3SDR1_9ACTN|nr:ferredoxin reductase [Solirubrobacter phytolaccae]MDA0183965.1 ferredoxin reductase [Solirubrobacter phytolaccae]